MLAIAYVVHQYIYRIIDQMPIPFIFRAKIIAVKITIFVNVFRNIFCV